MDLEHLHLSAVISSMVDDKQVKENLAIVRVTADVGARILAA